MVRQEVRHQVALAVAVYGSRQMASMEMEECMSMVVQVRTENNGNHLEGRETMFMQ